MPTVSQAAYNTCTGERTYSMNVGSTGFNLLPILTLPCKRGVNRKAHPWGGLATFPVVPSTQTLPRKGE